MNATITKADILDLVEYERKRSQIRESAMAARRLRRVPVGSMVSVSFENVQTVKYQIQEMIRAERLVDDKEIQAEIDVYSDLLPEADSLAATMFIEIDDPILLREWLPRLVGLEQAVSLDLGAAGRCRAAGEEGRSKENITATVHYLRFPFGKAQIDAMRSGEQCMLRTDHDNYTHVTAVSDECVKALIADLDGARS